MEISSRSRSRRFVGDNAVNLPPSEVSEIPDDGSATQRLAEEEAVSFARAYGSLPVPQELVGDVCKY